mgnify:CR=1 FL=1
MKVFNKAITGQETELNEVSHYASLVDFYTAFNHQDFALMEQNWLMNEQASMSNPLGGVKRGWLEINEVYKKIFNGKAKVYVEFYDYSIHASENMFIAVGRERGLLEIDNQKIELAIRTSRTYCLLNNQWKQVHHHGSMDNPELLATYQNALKNK